MEDAWDRMIALGPSVREPPHLDGAWNLACETMLKVRANLETILERLDEIGYQRETHHGLGAPATDGDLDEIERITAGALPLSLRAFWGIVGSVDLVQSKDQLVNTRVARLTSDLEVIGLDDPLFVESASEVLASLRENPEPDPPHDDHRGFMTWLALDRFHKANQSGGEGYFVWLPDARADFRIFCDVCAPEESADGESFDGQFFVRMLRQTMRYGGFRGPVDGKSDTMQFLPPREIQRRLAEGLLPI